MITNPERENNPMSEDNKAFYSRMIEQVWNNGDGSAIGDFYAPD